MKRKLAIFDLDGTLFDTFKLNFHSYEQALREHGFTLSEDYFLNQCQGKPAKVFLKHLIGSDPVIFEAVHKRKKIFYREFLSFAKENVHLFEIAEALKGHYVLALVTTASQQNCLDLLKHFGRQSFFDLIVTQEDVEHLKPNPEGFLKAMSHFKVASVDTVIFEDSSDGLEAALATGATVFRHCI